MGFANSWSRIPSWTTSSHQKVNYWAEILWRIFLSFLALIKHTSSQSKADIRLLSTFFIGSSVAVMNYCPPIGLPEKDNKLIYGKSQNLNKIRYYQETMKWVSWSSILSYFTKINLKINAMIVLLRNVHIKQFGIWRHRFDVLLGVGMAVLVVVLKILGSFCDFMIALANVNGKLW